jgi:DNA adenine methylase
MESFFEENKIEGEGIKAFMARTGGKSKLKKLIVDDIFPRNYQSMIYVEPFIGAGHVYFYKDPSEQEVINDLDKDVVQIFKGFKKYNGDDISACINGNYNKKIYKQIKESKETTPFDKFIQKLLQYKLSFFGAGKSFGSKESIHSNYENNYKDRLKHTTILNKDYKYLIKKYDSHNTLFYLDPPYENSDKLYTHDNVSIDEVYNLLKNIKGKFVMSYNDSSRAKELFKDYTIKKVKTKYASGDTGGQQVPKTELIITNV